MWKTSVTMLLVATVNATLKSTPAMGYIGYSGVNCP